MAASEVFAEAHGAAEEALKVFLVKRGKVLREGMASVSGERSVLLGADSGLFNLFLGFILYFI